MKIFIHILLISILLLSLGEFIKDSDFSPHYVRSNHIYGKQRVFKLGDSLEWAAKEYDDQHWFEYPMNFDTSSVFWMRQKFSLPNILKAPKALRLQALASYDLFWDGVQLGGNGKVGLNKAAEAEGKMNTIFILPDSLRNRGEHILALRASNFYASNKVRIFRAELGSATDIYTNALIFTMWMHLLAGVFLIIGIYYFFQFGNEKKITAFLFGTLCLVFFLQILFEYLKFYYDYPYSFHYKRLWIIEILTSTGVFLLPAFLISRFEIPNRKLLLGIIILVIVLIELRFFPIGHDLRIMLLHAFTLLFSSCLALWAYFKKYEGSEAALIGIIPSLLIFYYYDALLFIAFFNLILFNLLSLSKQVEKTKRERNEALLQSTRLELDLLKKNIQPHFLMNTLTAVIEWIEKEPEKAVQFVEALADEFKILVRISNKKLITLKEELELCTLHLKIMNMRKGVRYSLTTDNVDLENLIPPGVLHTVVENGISHNIANSDLSFVLEDEETADYVCYELNTIGREIESKTIKEGTGTKYIKARLTESFGQRWAFDQYFNKTGWMIRVKIYKS